MRMGPSLRVERDGPGRLAVLSALGLLVLFSPFACGRRIAMSPRPAEPACRGGAAAEAGGPVIRWYAPAAPDLREELARWCATVGPPVIELRPGPQMVAVSSEGALTVISWNAAVGGGDLIAFLKGELDLDCTGGVPRPGARFSHFALLVQEAHRLSERVPELEPGAPVPLQIDPRPRPGPMLDITEIARRCDLALVYVPSARNGRRAVGERREDKGNAILATFPLAEVIAVELPLEASRKVVVGAKVVLPQGGVLRVVSAHLDVSAGLARILISGNSWRLDQARAIVDALRLADSEPASSDGHRRSVATLVAGDFNVWSKDDSALQLLRREYPDSPAWTGEPTRGPFALDHLFFAEATDARVQRLPGSFRRIADRYYSDHHGLAIQLVARE